MWPNRKHGPHGLSTSMGLVFILDISFCMHCLLVFLRLFTQFVGIPYKVIQSIPIGSMYGIYANIGGILMVNVTIYGIHGSYGILDMGQNISNDCTLLFATKISFIALTLISSRWHLSSSFPQPDIMRNPVTHRWLVGQNKLFLVLLGDLSMLNCSPCRSSRPVLHRLKTPQNLRAERSVAWGRFTSYPADQSRCRSSSLSQFRRLGNVEYCSNCIHTKTYSSYYTHTIGIKQLQFAYVQFSWIYAWNSKPQTPLVLSSSLATSTSQRGHLWSKNTSACWDYRPVRLGRKLVHVISYILGVAKLELPTIYKVFIWGLCKGISPPNMVLYTTVPLF